MTFNRDWYKNNYQHILKYNKNYKEKNLEQYKKWHRKNSKKYYELCRDEIAVKKHSFYLKNKDRILKKGKEWKQKNQNYIKEWRRKWTEKNRAKILERQRNYARNNPEKRLQYRITHYQKYGYILGFPNWQKFKYGLDCWSDTIRKRDNHLCKICKLPAEIAHHILFKAFYPQLALNENNGISLCKSCHNEYHYGVARA